MEAALSEVRRGLDREKRKFWSPRAREELHLFLILGLIILREDQEGDSEQEVLGCTWKVLPPPPSGIGAHRKCFPLQA